MEDEREERDFDKEYDKAVENSGQYVTEEVEWVRADIADTIDWLSQFEGKIEDANVADDLEELFEFAEKSYKILDEIEDEADDITDPEKMRELWGKMEQIHKYVEPRLMNVMDYVDSHRNELGGEDDDFDFIEVREEQGADCRNCERGQDIYGDDFDVLQEHVVMTDDLLADLIQQVTADVLAQISVHLEELGDELVNRVMGQMDYFKGPQFQDDIVNRILDNNARVFEGMAQWDPETYEDAPSTRAVVSEFKDLREEFKVLPMPDANLSYDIRSYWEDVAEELNSGEGDLREMEDLVEEGHELLDEAVLAKYENKLGFKDVPGPLDPEFGDNWFDGYVSDGLASGYWEGMKDSGGSLTYEYMPSSETLGAEAWKMILSVGYSEASKSGSDWWAGWEASGNALGLTAVDMPSPITRGEVFRTIYEAYDFAGSASYRGTFPDVTAGDDYEPVEALYAAGIVTGDGDTGNVRLDDTLNRAEMAALMMRVAEWYEEQDLIASVTVNNMLASEREGSEEQASFWSRLFVSISGVFSK